MTSKIRSRDCRYDSNKIWNLVCVLVIAVVATTGCTAAADDRPNNDVSSSAEPAALVAAQPDSQTTELDVPESIQVTPAVASCSSQHGTCINRNLCIANDGRPISASGCASGTVCCRFNPCLNAGDACTTAAVCRVQGRNTGLAGCSTGQVCCRFE